MKNWLILFLLILISIVQGAAQQNIGINTLTPLTTLHVNLGESLSNGILFTGMEPSGGTFPSLGGGRRFMFYPGKAALRAGVVEDFQWDDVNVGSISMAFGFNTIASGSGSFATGDQTKASGGISSVFGSNTIAKGYCSMAVGMYNDSLLSSDQGPPTAYTPLFMVGNGDGNATRNNAMVVYKNGNMILKNPTTVVNPPGMYTIPVSGAGTRMMWLPEMGSFRVGTVLDTAWNASNIGLASFASGINNIASGGLSTATGFDSKASGAISTAIGLGSKAKGYSSIAIGMYNDPILTTDQTAIEPITPLFMIGNGDDDDERNNAMVVYKNGNMILKNPLAYYYNKLPNPYPIPISGEGTRMMWLPEISAFRVGTVSDTAWNATNIGEGSFASGVNSIASGGASTATGFGTKASGDYSTATGGSTVASGNYSTALGKSSRASGLNSISTGELTIASGLNSTAMGYLNLANSTSSSSSGYRNIAKGFSSTVIGMYNDSILTTNEVSVTSTTPLFIIGNGSGASAGQRSNAMVVRKDGHVGLGTNVPSATLHVNGTLKVVDGTQGAGKILTSDVNGLASWQPPPPPSPTYYQSVSICCQSWMTKNLDVSTYRNGDAIPKVTNNADWEALTTGAYCYYDNDSTMYAATYGKLYNWYAVNDPRGLAPEGWHCPTDFEWTTLGNCLGGDAVAGGPMKEIGTTHWTAPNVGASNLSGFTGLPGGYRTSFGAFALDNERGFWWSSTDGGSQAIYRYMTYNFDDLYRTDFNKVTGLSVRCIRD